MQRLENIQSRLLKTLAERMHCREEEIDGKTRLLAELTAWNFSVLYREMTLSQSVVRKNIMRSLMPDVQARAVPAHAIGYAYPKTPNCVLNPEQDEFIISRESEDFNQGIFFSPVYPTALVQARIRYFVYDRTLEEVTALNSRQIVAHAGREKTGHPGVAWLGIEVASWAELSKGLTLYLDWNLERENRQEALQDMRSLVKWFQGDRVLTAQKGYGSLFPDEGCCGHPEYLDKERLGMKNLEKAIYKAYENRYLTLTDLQRPEEQGGSCPEELNTRFGETHSQRLCEKNLIWLKMVFPAGVNPAEISTAKILLNCFPIVNRKLEDNRDFSPSGNSNIEIRSLSNGNQHKRSLSEEGKYFLGVQKIFSANNEYRPALFESFRQAPSGFYAVQDGRVEHDDYRDLRLRVLDLAQYIESRSSALRLSEMAPLGNIAENLYKILATVEEEILKKAPVDRDNGYYMYIKLLDPQEMIYVRIWSTQGELANRAAAPGDFLVAQNTESVEGKIMQLITVPQGGTAPLDEKELTAKLKKLLTNVQIPHYHAVSI